MTYPTHLLVNYSVTKESIPQIKNAIIAMFEELKETPVHNVFYSVYQLGSCSFIHLQCFPCEAACKYIFSLPSFQGFFKILECSFEEVPIANDVEKIGCYDTLGKTKIS